MPLNIVITMILCFMFMDGKLSRIEGLILLAGMAAYIVSMIYSALKNRETGKYCVYGRRSCGSYFWWGSCGG